MGYYVELDNSKKRKALMNHLKVTSAAFSMYLNFKRNSKNAHKARVMAIEAGGKLYRTEVIDRGEAMKILDSEFKHATTSNK